MAEMTWIWVLIPITAIAMKGFREWLRFKATQRQLGASTEGLEREVAEMRRTNETLLDRIQNLEAIVVSQTWNALNDHGLAPAERELKVASVARRELKAPDASSANQQRAEQLARRLQG
ncbi:MAG TPA: hypothetical protein VIA62_04920 [Thermoanaerobaculia bacterium]|jgi:hypothetical protein|nr:hypothetical protein [Thermoanaerobaculia bacterium]